MKKNILIVVLVVFVLALGAWIIYLSRPDVDDIENSEGQNEVPDIQNQDNTEQENLRVNNLQAGDTVSSPLGLSGEAAGWYFEGSFPVRVEDKDGQTLGQGFVTAQDDWMTSDFVPFEGTITFASGEATQGRIVFMKDNPSGLPENDESMAIPVQFEQDLMEVKIFFNNNTIDPDMLDCNRVYATTRTIPRTQTVGAAAIRELLRGISMEEESQGFATQIPSGVQLQSLHIENGTAYADFHPALDFQVGGSCRVSAIRSQITETLKQFPTVDNVIISINGETETILQP